MKHVSDCISEAKLTSADDLLYGNVISIVNSICFVDVSIGPTKPIHSCSNFHVASYQPQHQV